jgi:4,5-DOPA dioxygenase extradiol
VVQLDTLKQMPVLFVGHGSPMNAIEENEFVNGFRDIAKTITEPVAILCVSAHWETKGTFVTAADTPKTIHDFFGFPEELYQVQYPAPGSPSLAKEIKNLIKKTNVGLNYDWGLDHGCWVVMKHFFPNADVPIVQLSLDHFQSAQFHYDLAKELLSLRRKGILIVGSGNMVHNLALVDWDKLDESEFGYNWALKASEKMKEYILSDEHKALINYQLQGREFDLAIPTFEHYLPLLFALALKSANEKITIFNDKPVWGSVTMTSLKIG